MSFDLYFNSPRISEEDFNQYFLSRENYSEEDGSIAYFNRDTGVYFSFTYEVEPEADEDEEYEGIVASFMMNNFRPHVFGLEAEPEVREFVERFGFTLDDPQSDEKEDDTYSSEKFLKSWNEANEFAYKAVISQKGETVFHTRPTSDLEMTWLWNLHKEQRTAELTEDIFIPRIFYILHNDRLASCCVWPDGIPALIPKVDVLYIPREDLAPKPLFGKREKDSCLIPVSDCLKILAQYETNQYGMPAFKLPVSPFAKEVTKFVRKLPKFKGEIQAVDVSEILNSELVAEAKGG